MCIDTVMLFRPGSSCQDIYAILSDQHLMLKLR